MMKVFYRGLAFTVDEGVYEPAEDSFLMADNLEVNTKNRVLDLGTGCGILAVLSALEGAEVVATDISKKAIDCAKKNARAHGVHHKIDFRVGDLFAPVRGEKFDTILFNPPYLPASGKLENDPAGVSCESGPDGRAHTERFLAEFVDYLQLPAKVMLVQSSLSNYALTVKKLLELKAEIEIVEKPLPFEKLALIKASLK